MNSLGVVCIICTLSSILLTFHVCCQVFNVEIALDLSELNALTAERQSVRDKLEKAIAAYEATNVRPQVTAFDWAILIFDSRT